MERWVGCTSGKIESMHTCTDGAFAPGLLPAPPSRILDPVAVEERPRDSLLAAWMPCVGPNDAALRGVVPSSMAGAAQRARASRWIEALKRAAPAMSRPCHAVHGGSGWRLCRGGRGVCGVLFLCGDERGGRGWEVWRGGGEMGVWIVIKKK